MTNFSKPKDLTRTEDYTSPTEPRRNIVIITVDISRKCYVKSRLEQVSSAWLWPNLHNNAKILFGDRLAGHGGVYLVIIFTSAPPPPPPPPINLAVADFYPKTADSWALGPRSSCSLQKMLKPTYCSSVGMLSYMQLIFRCFILVKKNSILSAYSTMPSRDLKTYFQCALF